jgi:hypothetical protein
MRVLQVVSVWYVISWSLGAVLGHQSATLRWLVAELQPLYLPAVVVVNASGIWVHHDPLNAWRLVGTACALANYWLFKDNDDDRWKRRRRKLAERIARIGSRLVVVPDGAS